MLVADPPCVTHTKCGKLIALKGTHFFQRFSCHLHLTVDAAVSPTEALIIVFSKAHAASFCECAHSEPIVMQTAATNSGQMGVSSSMWAIHVILLPGIKNLETDNYMLTWVWLCPVIASEDHLI